MSKRPFKITFSALKGDDLNNFVLNNNQYQALTGYSVSLESFVALGLKGDNLYDTLGFNVNMTTIHNQDYFPENVFQDGTYDGTLAPLCIIPFNSLTVPSAAKNVIWTNPDTWGSRTKVVFDLYNPSIISFNSISESLITSYDSLQFTLAFYDEQVSSNEPQTEVAPS